MKHIVTLFFVICSALPLFGESAVKFSARADKSEIGAGEVFNITFGFNVPDGVHIYGPEENDVGMPTKISLALPDGWTVKSQNWPKTSPFEFMGMEAAGYSADINAVFTVEAAAKISTTEKLDIAATAEWLECSELCVPVKAEANIEIFAVQSDAVLKPSGSGTSFLGVIFAAFLGGMILNLMPCVFPVIGIKIMSFAQTAGESRAKALKSAAVYALGIVLSFLALAALLMGLRALGENLGWGFQLQNPIFTALMALLFFALALSFAGVFEIGASLAGKAVGAQGAKNKYLSAFLSGVLAVLVASPCTAPFMGSALGAALAADASDAMTFSIFAALGVGMAFPYILLSAIPAAAKAMPKPGAWMEVFKQILSIPLFATVVWLVWVYSKQTDGVAHILSALLLLAVGLRIFGMYAMPHMPKNTRIFALAACIALSAAAIYVSAEGARTQPPATEEIEGAQTWSAALQDELRKDGRIVYVDFTASWCLTCQFNKTVLNGAGVKAAFEKNNIAVLVGDWTNKDEAISEELKKFGRAGVPLNLLYPPDTSKPPVVLPAILTESAVIDAIDKIKQ